MISATQVPTPVVSGIVGGYPPSLPAAAAAGGESPHASGDLREVAQGFEAMLLRQVLSAAGKTSFGGDELFGSSSDKTFTEMRDARFAELASSSGSLGLAAQIEAQLSRQLEGGG